MTAPTSSMTPTGVVSPKVSSRIEPASRAIEPMTIAGDGPRRDTIRAATGEARMPIPASGRRSSPAWAAQNPRVSWSQIGRPKKTP